MLKIKSVQVIETSDWDGLVEETYGKPYCFQQQDGCKGRQQVSITIPSNLGYDEYEDVIPDGVDTSLMGVNFEVWKSIDPEEFNKIKDSDLHWGRTFYPDVQMVANDLHAKGLIAAGKYQINIDW